MTSDPARGDLEELPRRAGARGRRICTIEKGEFFTLLGPSAAAARPRSCAPSPASTARTAGDIYLDDECIDDVPAAPAGHRHGLPELRGVPPHDGLRERRLRPAQPARARGTRSGRGSARALAMAPPDRLREAHPRPALRRPAAAGGPGAGHGHRAAGPADGRAPVQPRRQAARRDARPRSATCSASSGITTVYVTHDQEEALVISDRIAVMKAGRVQQVGRPWEIYKEPGNIFVASFVGQDEPPRRGCRRRPEAAVAAVGIRTRGRCKLPVAFRPEARHAGLRHRRRPAVPQTELRRAPRLERRRRRRSAARHAAQDHLHGAAGGLHRGLRGGHADRRPPPPAARKTCSQPGSRVEVRRPARRRSWPSTPKRGAAVRAIRRLDRPDFWILRHRAAAT